jgi:hypothetical protein
MTMPTFSTDSLHPDRLRCDDCGETVCVADEPATGLTAQQAAIRWPDRAEAIREHQVICTWRQNPPPADGSGVYIHMRGRDEGRLPDQ